ncbi:unnamed protein product [Chironomus riparius]|uniref:Uncharacterized protein n=1 Tax=Chironomus riparius TaxID=315576 RepID=A0A9N9WXP7_9DIPT|nr:unnamed protein product [Chironomus riparius]
MRFKASSLSSLIIIILIYSLFPNLSTCSAKNLDTEILELKIKAITSFELSSMSFDELPSLFFLYENLVHKRFESVYKNNLKKFEEFRKVHQHYAIKSSFYSLKLSDVIVFQDFNAADLQIISNKINWSDKEVNKFGFLSKDKYGTFKFHDQAFADFFIAQYFYDNIVHPKDSPSDDEMELRLRFFFYIIANIYDRYSVTNEFIMAMIEDQNDEMFSDQVRMLMKYKFDSLLDPYLIHYSDYVEKMSSIFAKDKEILCNLWGTSKDLPFFLRYLQRSKFGNPVKELKAIAERFFKIASNSSQSTMQADQIFRGKNQILTVLYTIHLKKNENFTKDILDVTKYQVSDDILVNLNQYEDFLDFVDASSYSLTDKKEFIMSNAYNMIGRTWTAENLTKLWNRMEKYFTKNEMKLILTQKDQHFNHTHLFHLPSRFDLAYPETYLNLTRTYLSPEEIKEFLSHRRLICQESFLTHYMNIAENATVYELNYNFTKEFLTHEELKNLIFVHKDKPFIQKFADNQEIFTICTRILSEFYTKDEIQDMLMVTDENNRNIIFWTIDALSGKIRHDFADYLRDIFKGREDKLKQMFKIKSNFNQTIFDKFDGSMYKEKVKPFLDLAKEIFTDEELRKLQKSSSNE